MNLASVIHGDNLDVLASLQARSIDRERPMLVYCDPPFFSQKTYKMHGNHEVAFEDRWPSLMDYLQHLAPRFQAIHDLLHERGSLVVHIDSRVSHHVRTLLDCSFGEESFRAEIVWRYRRWPSPARRLQRVHDTLLHYAASDEYTFNQLYEPHSPSTLKTWGTKKQRANFTGNRRVRSESTEEESPGVPLGDVWEIPIVAPNGRERTGYPTQKPEALLSRIIQLFTARGDLVLDPYAGSGTTLAVANQLGRRSIGIDSSEVAIKTIIDRTDAAMVAA